MNISSKGLMILCWLLPIFFLRAYWTFRLMINLDGSILCVFLPLMVHDIDFTKYNLDCSAMNRNFTMACSTSSLGLTTSTSWWSWIYGTEPNRQREFSVLPFTQIILIILMNSRYYESHCGMVNGSFGEGWPPYQSRTNITMYSTDLCRSI